VAASRIGSARSEEAPPPDGILDAWAAKIANQDDPVVVFGETGTGKSELAKALHRASARATGPFAHHSGGEFASGNIESTLFGHVRGAFTGADSDRAGLLEGANGGTLIIDDVDNLPTRLQSRLLRFLDDGAFHRMGEPNVQRSADVRLIVTTNKDLPDLCRAGQFLQDLYFRLAHWKIHVPPLRDRTGDLRRLAQTLLADFDRKQRRPPRRFSDDALDLFVGLAWEGNIRELRMVVHNIALGCDILEGTIPVRTVIAVIVDRRLLSGGGGLPFNAALSQDERIYRLLGITKWNINVTAQLVGISRNTVYDRIERHGWRKPD